MFWSHWRQLATFEKLFNLVKVDSSGTNAFYVKKSFSDKFDILSSVKSWKSVDRNNSEEQINFIKIC